MPAGLGHDRQIGTTGVKIRPVLYLALGISGASQHLDGLGEPQHVISVNRDASAPMTVMSDFGIVTDAPALLVEMARRLGVRFPTQLRNSLRRIATSGIAERNPHA